MKASIIIRTLNEELHLKKLLCRTESQQPKGFVHEVIIVDSGSTDRTLDIADEHGCRIIHIERDQFSFGRSLNIGCSASDCDFLVFISGHCIPISDDWLFNLCLPIVNKDAVYCYGRQIGDDSSHFSESQIFLKYFPALSAIPQDGIFCNNANAAIHRSAWVETKFDEDLTGLEDMALAKVLIDRGMKIGYVSEATVLHLHSESWQQVRRRFARESFALNSILPRVHLTFIDALRYYLISCWSDICAAHAVGKLFLNILDIIFYRFHQYLGSYIGNQIQRDLSAREKDAFFYPDANNFHWHRRWLRSNIKSLNSL